MRLFCSDTSPLQRNDEKANNLCCYRTHAIYLPHCTCSSAHIANASTHIANVPPTCRLVLLFIFPEHLFSPKLATRWRTRTRTMSLSISIVLAPHMDDEEVEIFGVQFLLLLSSLWSHFGGVFWSSARPCSDSTQWVGGGARTRVQGPRFLRSPWSRYRWVRGRP